MSRRPAPAGRSAAPPERAERRGAARAADAVGDAVPGDGAARGGVASDRAARGAAPGGKRSAIRPGAGVRTSAAGPGHSIPDATIARLPIYLRALYALAGRDVATVSSEELAAAAGVNSAKLRKDLSHLGSYGTRGVGYDVDYLVYQVSRELGLTQDWPVLIVGAGNLGRALANYGGFASRGFRIAALVDSDPAVVGSMIGRHTVRAAADIEDIIRRFDVAIGVIATPAPVAQNVCDRLVAAGVPSILNFAPVVLSVPCGVEVRKVDLSIELQILAFHAQRRGAAVRQPDRTRDGHPAARLVGGVPLTAGAPGTGSVPDRLGLASSQSASEGDAAGTESLKVAELSATALFDGAAGLAATVQRSGVAAVDYDGQDHGTPDDFQAGVRAVGR